MEENITGLTDEELDMLKQNNIDSFIQKQKRLNSDVSKFIQAQNKLNQETTEYEKTLEKVIDLQNQRITNLYKTLIFFGSAMILFFVTQVLERLM